MADPDKSEAAIRTDAEHVRGGETTGIMRYILGISLFLAIAVLSAIWIIPALLAAK